jgi:transcriptional regulator of nitric oxide reductase
VALVLDGDVSVTATPSLVLTPGRAAFIEVGDGPVSFDGRGVVVVASGVATA